MKQVLNANEFIEQHKMRGWRRIQIRKLIYVSRVLFHLDLHNVTVVICTDAKWPARRNRTPLERLAVKIGHSVYVHKNQESQYVIWAYPTISVPIRSRDECQKVMLSFNGHQRKPPAHQATKTMKAVKPPKSI